MTNDTARNNQCNVVYQYHLLRIIIVQSTVTLLLNELLFGRDERSLKQYTRRATSIPRCRDLAKPDQAVLYNKIKYFMAF